MFFLRNLREMLVESIFIPIAFFAAEVIMLPMITDPKFSGPSPMKSKVIALIVVPLVAWLVSAILMYFYKTYYKFYFGGYSSSHNRTYSEKKALLEMTARIANKASVIFNREFHVKRELQFISVCTDPSVTVFAIDLSDPTDLADPANFLPQSTASVFSLHYWVAKEESLVRYIHEQLKNHESQFPQLTPPQITYGRIDESLAKTGTITIEVINPKNNTIHFPKQPKLLKGF